MFLVDVMSLDNLFAALKARNEIFVKLMIWFFSGCSISKQTWDGILPMYSCIIIEEIVAHYYYTLLHCNDPSVFTMLLRRHKLIRNDFLHCWWPSWCFAQRIDCNRVIDRDIITYGALLAAYLDESSSRNTVNDNILCIDYTLQAYTYVVNYVSRVTVNVDLSDK